MNSVKSSNKIEWNKEIKIEYNSIQLNSIQRFDSIQINLTRRSWMMAVHRNILQRMLHQRFVENLHYLVLWSHICFVCDWFHTLQNSIANWFKEAEFFWVTMELVLMNLEQISEILNLIRMITYTRICEKWLCAKLRV